MEIKPLIGKRSNYIEDRLTDERYYIDILPLSRHDLKQVLKKNGWHFNWRSEFLHKHHTVYKLIIQGDTILQGLISIEIVPDHIELPLIETAPHNFGRNKKYNRVAGNLVAFACKASFDLGFEGNTAFKAKTLLIQHYMNTFGAEVINKNRMAITTDVAKKLVNLYYKS